jgi:hypothetical protein
MGVGFSSGELTKAFRSCQSKLVRTYVHVYVFMYVCMYVCTYVCVCVYV